MSKIINFKNIKSIRKKITNKKVVMCHGVFDLLHLGHILHFEQAKKMGDILIVSVTSDKYVKKGYGRPHFSISERIKSLTALSFVDYVIESDFPTAEHNIKKIKPNIYCKGSEYSKSSRDVTKNIIKEKQLIKKINAEIRFTSGKTFSSSTLINKYSQVFNEKQKLYLNKIKRKYSFSDIELYLKKISNLNLNVLGEIITDKYTYCEAVGTSGKDPFLVFEKKKDKQFQGGSLAIAKNLANFVKKINLISCYPNKKIILKNKNIQFDIIKSNKIKEIVKNRFVDINTNSKLFGIYSLGNQRLDNNFETKIIAKLKSSKKNNFYIISDYGHNLITKKISNFISQKKYNYTLNAQINSSNRGFHGLFKYKYPEAVIINTSELRYEFKDKSSSLESLILKLKKKILPNSIVVTRGSQGAISYNSKEGFSYCPAFQQKIIDKVGAGDSLLALFSLFKFVGAPNDLSLFVSSISAAYQVSVINNETFLDKTSLLKQLQHILK